MGIVTDKLIYGALSWAALDKNANDRGIKDTHTSDDVGILWAADHIATQAATIEALEGEVKLLIDGIHTIGKERDALVEATTITELLALIDAHNAAPCPQVFKVEVPAKYRDTSNG